MKKITYSFLLIFLVVTNVNAQFTVNKQDGTLFTNNEVIEFTTYGNSSAELKFTVQNNAAVDLDFRIRCTNLVNNTGTNFQLCWGLECIPDVALNGTYPNYQNVITAGGNTLNLGDSFKNFNGGDGTNYPMDYTFRFITRDLNGTQVGSDFYLTYRYQGPLSIEQKDKLSAMGVKVLNTLVTNYVGLEINKQVNYTLTNLQGQTINDGQLSTNTNLELPQLQTGLYFLNFTNNEGLVDSVKIYKK